MRRSVTSYHETREITGISVTVHVTKEIVPHVPTTYRYCIYIAGRITSSSWNYKKSRAISEAWTQAKEDVENHLARLLTGEDHD